ncbi:hypothetical protein IE53DRAFT_379508 [Violaceomyces palustris]|uniref:Uncharacterized protein n=1 Tax=Violaceomyces palustris TaxID=1673888 RepID=A0ACD0NY38_9BASI|nr:hypothetical protein IE53DRAFT_379508 [Violaceomyces palustris]
MAQLNSLLVTLVRHGESQDNLQSIWAGFRDSPLSATGQSQARALAQSMANLPLTAIYSSDLKRAAMTAEEILDSNRSVPPPPLVQSKSLREQNFGQAEGKSWANVEWANAAHGDDARNFKFKDGESLEEVNARMAKAVRQFVLPRIEALRKKQASSSSPSSSSSSTNSSVAAAATIANTTITSSSSTSTNTPHSISSQDTPHIVIVAHGIAIAELLRVFMSLHDNSPNAPWQDPRSTYKRVRLENTGWTRLEIAVPSSSPSGTHGGSAQGPATVPPIPSVAAPTPAPAIKSSSELLRHVDYGEIQTEMVEGAVDSISNTTMAPPSAPKTLIPPPKEGEVPPSLVGGGSAASNGKNIFVRILCQNSTDHLRGFVIQPPSSGGPGNQLGGGASAASILGGGGGGVLGLSNGTIGNNSNLISGMSSGGIVGSGVAGSVGVGSRGEGISATAGTPVTGSNASTNPTAPCHLPTSNTLASIASNATLSTSASNPNLATPSTPNAAGPASSGGTRSVAATPASARSLSSYDAKMMAKELERAGAAVMLSGSDGYGTPLGPNVNGSVNGSSRVMVGGNTSSGGAGVAMIGANESRSGSGSLLASSSTTGSSSSGLHSISAHQIPSSASSLYNTYAQAGGSTINNGASPSGSQFSFPASHQAATPNTPGATSDVWQSICVRVLPLFNGEGLRCSIEELNESVSLHVRKTLDRGPARALDSLSLDLHSLASSGMLTLNSKLTGLEDSRLLTRLVEVWTFFLGNVLPYVEGCFLPLQNDPVLSSLTSSVKAANAAVATSSAVSPNTLNPGLRTERIDTRRIVLAVFRDHVILPLFERLFYLFSHFKELDPGFLGGFADERSTEESNKQAYLRLLQMTSILASVLSEDEAQKAVEGLLRALRIGNKGGGAFGRISINGYDVDVSQGGGGGGGGFGNGSHQGRSTILGGALNGTRVSSPEQKSSNRRGWIPQKARKHGLTTQQPNSDGVGVVEASCPIMRDSTCSSSFPSSNNPFSSLNQLNPVLSTSPGVATVSNLGERSGSNNVIQPPPPTTTTSSTPSSTHQQNLPRFLLHQHQPSASIQRFAAHQPLSEEEYLTSLKSPTNSPAISTPPPPSEFVDSSENPNRKHDDDDADDLVPTLERLTTNHQEEGVVVRGGSEQEPTNNSPDSPSSSRKEESLPPQP